MIAVPESFFAFDYALLFAVPRVDRGERINVGVLLYSPAAEFLAAAINVDTERLRALDSNADVELIQAALNFIQMVCAGDPAAGPAATRSARARFGWLTAPRSTVVQPGAVHGGITAKPEVELDRLMDRVVR
ncbi:MULTISPECIES: DUF3037 domain-containing protein [Frankia]|uniref:DUF3037 domain-containing protein n=1 Tax=Frankia TaxID=1854 RepID=UPI001E3F27F7|nr:MULTISPECIES: DUF3037 domain-containing protein [Frankia]